MSTAIDLVCDDCGGRFPLHRPVNLCPACGGLLEVVYDLERVGDGFAADADRDWAQGMWRWRRLLPLPATAEPISLGEGNTPLVEARASGSGARVLVKNDGLMPTGSFKDRGFSLAVSFARAIGVQSCFTYSSGNAGASFSAYAARAGIPATVFAEEIANEYKLASIALFGASVHRLRFTESDEIFRSLDRLSERGEYSFVNFINPIRHEAMKVYAYELCEALGWRAPEVVVHPVGTGGGIWGAWKGFQELHALGLIDSLPRMVGVQPAACAPVVEAIEAGRESTIRVGDPRGTIAQSIATDAMLHGGRRVLRAIRDSGGCAVSVTDTEILQAMRDLGASGVSAEPSAAAAFAAVTALIGTGWIRDDETAIAVITATGLKQPSALVDAAPPLRGSVDAADADAWVDAIHTNGDPRAHR